MKKKGFTLIELLAVIVILAIIALIATPMIMGVIEKARKGSYVQSVNGILDAAEKYVILTPNNTTIDLTSDVLEYKGEKPKSGILLIDDKKHFSIIAEYGDYCIEKKFSDNSPSIVEKENCEFEDSEIIRYENYVGLNKSGNDCVTDSTKTCSTADIIAGLEVSVNVNDNENYTFNVLKDNGDSLDLQINFNIGSGTYWASIADYKAFTGSDCTDTNGCNDVGPITLLKKLKELTDKWSNIDNQTGEIVYSNNTIDMSNYKARLITFTEAQNLGCLGYKSDESNNDTCPLWFGTYYWTMSTHITSTSIARFIYKNAINDAYVINRWIQFRPVITVTKSVIK